MANKSRPKKVKAPYRKYVAGEGFYKVGLSKQGKSATSSTTTNDNAMLNWYENGGNLYKQEENTKDDGTTIQSKNDGTPHGCHTPIHTVMELPWEIQKLIIKYSIPQPPIEFLLVCKNWYFLTIPYLYYNPILSSRNFSKFVDAIIVDRKKRLGDNVHELDLSTILQSGKNSFVSKLLRRCSLNLEKFTAPQTSFGYAPLISLKSCYNLKYLDLGLVSETVKLQELFNAIKGFKNLTHLSFPRSSIDCNGCEDFEWPQNLIYLKLCGGITNEFVRETKWPLTIKTLEFSYCPQVDENAIYSVLDQIGSNLKNLYFHYPMPALRDNSLDYVFRYCPNLISIQLMIDYCTKWAFSEYMLTILEDYDRPLKTIYLESSGQLGISSKVHPDDFTIALLEHRLPLLKNISVSAKLGWDMKSEDVDDLVNALEEQDANLYSSY